MQSDDHLHPRRSGLENIPWLYDLAMSLVERGRFRRWRQWLVGGARGRVLEIGCGTGRNLPLYPAGVRVTAVDPWPQNVAAARRRSPRALLVQARAEALPFAAAAFDTTVASLVLCSVEDPARALSEIRRVLAPGGSVRAIEHVRARSRWLSRLQDAVQPAWTWVTGGCHPNRDTESLVAAAGLRISEDGRRARGLLRRFAASR